MGVPSNSETKFRVGDIVRYESCQHVSDGTVGVVVAIRGKQLIGKGKMTVFFLDPARLIETDHFKCVEVVYD